MSETENEEVQYEEEAKQDGWAPKEEWRGDPERWVDAKTFVENGKKINGILKSKVEKLESKLEANLQATKEFQQWTEKQREKERSELKARIKELETERATAVSEGDGQRFSKVDEELTELRNRQEDVPVNPQAARDVEAWAGENQWYQPNSNDALSVFADGLSDRLAAQGYTGKALLNEITRQVKETFPDKFENPKRKEPSSVETPGGSRDRPTSRTFDDLPPEDKAQCERFLKEIPGFTKEKFLEQYDWDEE